MRKKGCPGGSGPCGQGAETNPGLRCGGGGGTIVGLLCLLRRRLSRQRTARPPAHGEPAAMPCCCNMLRAAGRIDSADAAAARGGRPRQPGG